MRLTKLLMCVCLCVACSNADDPNAEARSKWADKQPAKYVVEVCANGFAAPVCIESAVENGQVVQARSRLRTDTSWRALDASEQEEPIEALFDEIGNGGCDVDASYNPTYGYVEHAYFDCGEEGYGKDTTCFAPDTTDLDACDSLAASGGAGGAN